MAQGDVYGASNKPLVLAELQRLQRAYSDTSWEAHILRSSGDLERLLRTERPNVYAGSYISFSKA